MQNKNVQKVIGGQKIAIIANICKIYLGCSNTMYIP